MRRVRQLAIVCFVVGCADAPTGPLDPDGALHPGRRADAGALNAQWGRAGFYFLPPLVPTAAPFAGESDPGLAPVVRVCVLPDCTTALVTLTHEVAREGDNYVTNWQAPADLALGSGNYRLEVHVGATLVGSAELFVGRKTTDLKDVFAPLIGVVRGSPVLIKFRIEKSVVGGIAVTVDPASIGMGGTSSVSGLVTDLHGNAMSGMDVSWDVSDPDVASIDPGSSTSGGNGVANAQASAGTKSGTVAIRGRSGGAEGSAQLVVTLITDAAPTVLSTVPANGATDVAAGSDIIVNFNEPVNASAASFTLLCGSPQALQAFNLGGTSPSSSYTLDPVADLPAGACVLTVVAAQVTDADAVDPPDGMAADLVVNFSVPVVTAPITANADAYTATGNIAIDIGGAGVLENDAPSAGVTVAEVQGSSANVGVFVNTTAGGLNGVFGRVRLESNGRFRYDPPPGFTGTDQFTYRMTDGTTLSSTGTVTITVADAGGALMWFVCDGCASNDRGTLLDPFTTIGSFSAANAGAAPAPQPGHALYVLSGTYDETLVLRNDQKVIGQGVDASTVFAPDANSVAEFGALVAGARPLLAPGSGDGVDLASGNQLRAVNVVTSAGGTGLDGTAGVGTLLISDVDVTGAGRALHLSGPGTVGATFGTLSSGGGAENLRFTGVNGTVTAAAGALSGATASAILVEGGGVGVTYAGGVTHAGAGALLDVRGGHTGAVSLTGAATATAGLGLRFDNADGAYNLMGATTLNGGDAAIGVVNGSGGTFNVPSGPGTASITNPQNHAVVISGSTPTFRYGGTITKNNGGPGILVQNNTGGTIQFAGVSLEITAAGAAAGVVLANNTGASITFSGGGLRIVTDDGNGLDAAGGGVLRVSGVNNTIASTGGIALNVATTIGLGGLTFRSISANGGPNGIVLNTTGSQASLTVTGDGVTPGSGGVIQNTTGADGAIAGNGIYLNNTRTISLNWMQLNDHQNHAIRGFAVFSFTMMNSRVSGANGTLVTGAGEGSIYFDGLTGSALFANTQVEGGAFHNLSVTNVSGTLDRLTLSQVRIGPNGSQGAHGVFLQPRNGATLRVTVDNSVFTASRGQHLLLDVQGNATSDVLFVDNVLSNNHATAVAGGGGVVLTSGSIATSAPTLTYRIMNNTLRDADGPALAVVKGIDSGNFRGTISGNSIGVPGVANSGSKSAEGIRIAAAVQGTHTVVVNGNTIHQYNGAAGLLVLAGGVTQAESGSAAHAASINATIANNTISSPGTLSGAPLDGIQLNAGSSDNAPAGSADAYQVCIDVGGLGGNTMAGSGANGGTEFRLRQRFATTVRLPGYAGSNTDDAAVVAFVSAQNGGASGAASHAVPPGGGFTGGAACTLP